MTSHQLNSALDALRAIAHPAHGMGFNALRGVARAELRKQAFTPLPKTPTPPDGAAAQLDQARTREAAPQPSVWADTVYGRRWEPEPDPLDQAGRYLYARHVERSLPRPEPVSEPARFRFMPDDDHPASRVLGWDLASGPATVWGNTAWGSDCPRCDDGDARDGVWTCPTCKRTHEPEAKR